MLARPRVLLVAASTSSAGGGEKHVADIMRSQAALGVELALACPGGGDLPQVAASLGIPAYAAATDGMRPAGVRELRAAIDAFEPDVVHAHGSRAAFFARLADPRAATRVLYTVHGIHIDKAGSPLRRQAFLAIEKGLRPKTARFIAVCASDVNKGARLGILDPDKTDVVYNGIELPVKRGTPGRFRRELGIADGDPLVVCIGRFHAQKDHRTLLAAFSRVASEMPRAVLALVGTGPLEGELRVQAVSLGLRDSVRFVAPRPDLSSVYADADVLALSSLWEGLPYVVIEALAYGLPVVATNVDGVPEAVVDHVSGRLVPSADADALSAALLAVLADPQGSRAMAETGRRHVEERFGLDGMVRSLAGIYSTMCERAERDEER